jgi:probable F420-dependent oxidoreductase
MLALARDRSAGAHPYFVPVEHTRLARGILGPDPLLAPEQAVVLEHDPEVARSIARRYLASYLPLVSYAANLRRLGWTEDQISGGGSDRLVDALVGWGSIEAALARVRAHLDAGADHVALRLLGQDPRLLPTREWAELAAALKGSGLVV